MCIRDSSSSSSSRGRRVRWSEYVDWLLISFLDCGFRVKRSGANKIYNFNNKMFLHHCYSLPVQRRLFKPWRNATRGLMTWTTL